MSGGGRGWSGRTLGGVHIRGGRSWRPGWCPGCGLVFVLGVLGVLGGVLGVLGGDLVGGEAGDKVKDWQMEEMAGGGASASECLLPR